ncbi:MAG: phosphoribosylaminoimidazolesuccinocarboxamide synthase, partial [Halobacteriota archaeon]
DGKIECFYHEGEVVVADVAGTFDENRFLYDDLQLSKEYVRQHYRSYDPDWVEAVEDAKREAEERGVADWRELCEIQPKPLSEEVVQLTSDVYRSGADRYTDGERFDAPSLDDVVERARRLRS